MNQQLLISPDKLSVVSLTAGERRIRLALRVTQEFTGGDLVEFSPSSAVAVEGDDELSSTYTRENWASGVASGMLYAFRALRIPRQRSVVVEMTGRLRACDMDAVAFASALAIAKLVGGDLPEMSTEGWAVRSHVTERQRPIVAEAYADEEAGTPAEPVKERLRPTKLRDGLDAPTLLVE